MTLLEALDAGPQPWFVLPGQPTPQKLSSLHAFVGAHVDEGSRFKQLTARIPGLQHWLTREWFTTEVGRSANKLLHVTIDATYPEPVSYTIPDAEVQFGLDVLSDHRRQGGFGLSTLGRLTIVPAEAQTFDWLLERFGRVTSLLTLMAGVPLGPDQVSVSLVDGDSDVSVLMSLRNPETCSLTDDNGFFLTERDLGI